MEYLASRFVVLSKPHPQNKKLPNMRKQLKLKAHSCALCKPHKMGWFSRWKNKDKAKLKEFEKTKKEINTRTSYD